MSKNRLIIFINIISRIVSISATFNIEHKIFFGEVLNLHGCLTLNLIEKLIIFSSKALDLYPDRNNRRNNLIKFLKDCFKKLLGESLNKKKVIDFQKLVVLLKEWNMVLDVESYYFNPPPEFTTEFTKIFHNPNPIYSFFDANRQLIFCSKKLEESNPKKIILYDSDFILPIIRLDDVTFIIRHLLSISSKDPTLLSIEFDQTIYGKPPNICILTVEEGMFFFSSWEPFFWSTKKQEIELLINNKKNLIYKKNGLLDKIKKKFEGKIIIQPSENSFETEKETLNGFKEIITDLISNSFKLANYFTRSIFPLEINMREFSWNYEHLNMNYKNLSDINSGLFSVTPNNALNVNIKIFSKNLLITCKDAINKKESFITIYKTKNQMNPTLKKLIILIKRL